MAWTQNDLAELDKAIKSGARSVRYSDREVTFHSLDDMLKLRAIIANEVGSTAPPPRTVGVYASGLQGSSLYGRRS